jgi:hypothetical protein
LKLQLLRETLGACGGYLRSWWLSIREHKTVVKTWSFAQELVRPDG